MSRHDFFRSSQRKRYQARQFKNPYFERQGPNRWRPWLITIGTIVVILGGMIFFLRAPAFAIQNIQIDGAESVSVAHLHTLIENFLQESRFGIFKRGNRFLFSKDALKDRLASAYAFDELDIGVEGITVRLHLKERQSQLLWNSKDHWFVVDLQGIVTRELDEAEITILKTPPVPDQLPLPLTELKRLEDVNDGPVTIGMTVLKPEEIVGIFRFHQHLSLQHIIFTETLIDRVVGKWMSVKTVTGYHILFDPTADVDAEAEHLAVLLRDTIQDTSKLEYIDLRFGDHVYYK